MEAGLYRGMGWDLLVPPLGHYSRSSFWPIAQSHLEPRVLSGSQQTFSHIFHSSHLLLGVMVACCHRGSGQLYPPLLGVHKLDTVLGARAQLPPFHLQGLEPWPQATAGMRSRMAYFRVWLTGPLILIAVSSQLSWSVPTLPVS